MNNNFNNKARYEQQPRVERESVNAAQEIELQSEETTKTGLLQNLADHKGMIAGGAAAVALAGGIYYCFKKGWIKNPFKKKAAAQTTEQPAEEPKKDNEEKK